MVQVYDYGHTLQRPQLGVGGLREQQKIQPFEVGGMEGEQRNPMAHRNPNPQLLRALNPLLRRLLGLSSECTLLCLFYLIKSLLSATFHPIFVL